MVIDRILRGVIILAALAAFVLVLNWGLERAERAECIRWAQELTAYPHLRENVAEWQVDQCQALGVPLPAFDE